MTTREVFDGVSAIAARLSALVSARGSVRFADSAGGGGPQSMQRKAQSAPAGKRPRKAGASGGVSLPSIHRGGSTAGEGGERRTQSTAGALARRSRSAMEQRPGWISKPSDEMQDLVKLEDRFRFLHSREANLLQQRMHNYSSAHQQLLSRQMQSTPLVVCVLDKFASGGGLLRTFAGQDVSFALQVKYSFAGHLGEGGEDLRSWIDKNGGFTCVLTGPTKLEADVVYQGAGTFIFFYRPQLAGKYLVSVRLGQGDVPGSPFESHVEPGKTDTASCSASGLGLLCAEAGVESTFNIISRDSYGNQRTNGGDGYEVALTGPVCFNANITDLNNGRYLVKYNSIMCGDYYVNVRRDGVPITGSPFVLSVVAGKTHGPSCTAIGDGLKAAFAGEDAELVIEARDIIGNQRVVGDDPFEVEIEGPSTPQISVFDRDDGTYLVTWNVEATGQYTMRILLHGLQISGSPFVPVVMPGRVVAVRCTGIGRGLTRAFAGEDAKFVVESRDINRNKTTSGMKPFTVTVRGVISPEVHMIPGDEGEYNYSYRTARAGIYFVSVLYDGVDIGGSPFKLTVDPGPTHANGCSASGPGISGGYTGMETSFVIQARDYYGNNRTVGNDIFNIDIGGTASARLRIRDNENGTYTVAYTPEIGGDYYISVKHSGVDIQGSPFTVASDPMPREMYLEMYRSMEPDFGKTMQGAMQGSVDPALQAKKEAQKASRKGKMGLQWDLNIKLIGGNNLIPKDTVGDGIYGTSFTHTSDPYVVVRLADQKRQSQTIEKNLNPKWNEDMTLTVTDRMEPLKIEVFDEDVHDDDDSMGRATVSVLDLVENKPKMLSVKLRDYDEGGNDKGIDCGEIEIVLTVS